MQEDTMKGLEREAQPHATTFNFDGLPPPAKLFRLSDLINPYAIRTAAILHIADELLAGPRPVCDLADACGVMAEPLQRLLRFLAQQEIFREIEPGVFALTPLAELLCTDGETSIHGELASLHGQRVAEAAANMLYSLQTGKSAYQDLFGETVFQFCARNPQASESFQVAMQANSSSTVEAAVDAYDWRDIEMYVDVGGCQGLLLATLLRENRHAQGILFDEEHVLGQALECAASYGVEDRCRFVAGDFFSSVPSGGDCYLLCNVLHDWDDDAASKILTSCHRAMPNGSRLLIIERIVPATAELHHAKYMDLRMLLVFGGRERTEAELTDLLRTTNFDVRRVVATESQASLIEATPSAS